ncbi:MAG: hypothetical protein WCX27_02440 [Candidatus Paceibacterota bacterium]|jgi:hypothetical protein
MPHLTKLAKDVIEAFVNSSEGTDPKEKKELRKFFTDLYKNPEGKVKPPVSKTPNRLDNENIMKNAMIIQRMMAESDKKEKRFKALARLKTRPIAPSSVTR